MANIFRPIDFAPSPDDFLPSLTDFTPFLEEYEGGEYETFDVEPFWPIEFFSYPIRYLAAPAYEADVLLAWEGTRYVYQTLEKYLEDQYKADNNKKDRLEVFKPILLFLQYLAVLLQRILQLLLLFCKFAEFPNRRRPKCTTMPWTIWPSLVVLWGVCWMFHPSPSLQSGTQDQFWNNEDLPSWDPSKTPSYTVEYSAKLTSTVQTHYSTTLSISG
jgi:hypothetical protein